MTRRFLLSLLLLVVGQATVLAQRPMSGSGSSSRQEAKPAPTAEPAAVAGEEAPTAKAAPRAQAIDGVPRIAQITWYGHAFVYITTPTGVRVAIDPYESENLNYTFPRNLAADVVLTTNERDDHAAANRLAGNPQVFRSYTAVGSNRANGLLFKGVEVPSEERKDFDVSKCTAFVFEIDDLRYVHFGTLADKLSSPEARKIGKADVIFVPVGNKTLEPRDVEKTVEQLEAKVIVPIKFKTENSGGFDLKTLDEFLDATDYPTKEIGANKFNLRPEMLPSEPTVYLLKDS